MTREIEASLLRILDAAGKPVGAGFLVTKDLAVTCAHVIEAAGAAPGSAVQVAFRACGVSKPSEVFTAQVEADSWGASAAEDVAFLCLSDALPEGVTPALLGRSAGTSGHGFRTFGFPAVTGTDGVNGGGEILGATTVNGVYVLQLRSPEVTPGFSGAPVFDGLNERVVGMIVSIVPPDTYNRLGTTAFAIPVERLIQVCSLHKNKTETVPLLPPQPVTTYLAAVQNYCERLPSLSVDSVSIQDNPRPIYIPLQLRERLSTGQVEDVGSVNSPPCFMADLFQRAGGRPIWISGQAGAGKSTLMRQLARQAWDGFEALGLARPHLPLLIPLRQLAGANGFLEERLNHILAEELALPHGLPGGFLQSWPDQTGADWLMLLDGADEIPVTERERLLTWLWGNISLVKSSQWVITSRPLSSDTVGFASSQALQAELLPFTTEQTLSFARQRFGERAERFLESLQRIRMRDLQDTPLFLTIAAKVFSSRDDLAEHRSALYTQFVDRLLEEAGQRGLSARVGTELIGLTRPMLARLALVVQEYPAHIPSERLYQTAASYLHQNLGYSLDRASGQGKMLVQALAQYSGIFILTGGEYDFVHPTLREYFAAWGLVHLWQMESARAWRFIGPRYGSEKWKPTLLFAVGLMSEAGKRIPQLESELQIEGGLYDWENEKRSFLVQCLINGAVINIETQERLQQALMETAREGYYRSSTAAGELAGLGWTEALRAVLLDERLSEMQGVFLVDEVIRHGSILMAQELGNDSRLRSGLRIRFAQGLEEAGYVNYALPIWLEVARSGKLDLFELKKSFTRWLTVGYREKAAQVLICLCNRRKIDQDDSWRWVKIYELTALIPQLENPDAEAQVWLAIVYSSEAFDALRRDAVEALTKLNRIEELTALVQDVIADLWARFLSARELWRLGYKEQTIPVWREVAFEAAWDLSYHLEAVAHLTALDQFDILLALAESPDIEPRLRYDALGALAYRCSRQMTGESSSPAAPQARVLNLVRTFILDETIDPTWRVHFVGSLSTLGDLAMVLTLAQDANTPIELRCSAASHLEDKALATAILRDLAHDETLPGQDRSEAANQLGWMGFLDEAVKLLTSLSAQDPTVRGGAAFTLSCWRRTEEAVEIYSMMARDPQQDSSSRWMAIEKLGSLRHWDQPELDLAGTFACETAIDGYHRREAIDILEKYGQSESAKRAWEMIAKDGDTSKPYMLIEAGEALHRLGEIASADSAWLSAARRWPDLYSAWKKTLAEDLPKIQNTAVAIQAAMAMVDGIKASKQTEDIFDGLVFEQVIQALAKVDCFAMIHQLALDSSLSEGWRSRLPAILYRLQGQDVENVRVRQALQDLVCDSQILWSIRYDAAQWLDHCARDASASSSMILQAVEAWGTLISNRGLAPQNLSDALRSLLKYQVTPPQTAPGLIALIMDAQADWFVREKAITALGWIQSPDEPVIAALKSIAQQTGNIVVDDFLRFEATASLYRLGRVEAAFQAWMMLAQEPDVEPEIRGQVVDDLLEKGTTELLSALANNTQFEADLRIGAIKRLVEMGKMDSLETLAREASEPLAIRSAAVVGLIAQRAGEALEALMMDPKQEQSLRVQAARGLHTVDQSVGALAYARSRVLARGSSIAEQELGLSLLAAMQDRASLAQFAHVSALPDSLRLEAVSRLQALDSRDELLALFGMAHVPESGNAQIVDHLIQNKDFTRLMDLARRRELPDIHQKKIIQCLKEGERISSLLELGHNEQVDPGLRNLAGQALADMGLI